MWGGGGELLLLLLAAGELALCSPKGTGCTLYNGIQGEDFTLPPNVSGTLSEIIWKKKVDETKEKYNKVAEWDGALLLYSHLLDRAEIDPGSGNLTIRNISQMIDGGTYKAEALVGGSYQFTYVCLEILDPPSAPNLTCSIDDDGIHVNCMSVTHYDLSVSYHWNYIKMNDISESNSTKEFSSVKLPKNTAPSENITCTIVVSRSAVSTSISLMTCDSIGSPPQKRGRTIAVALILVALIIGLAISGLVFLRKRKDIPERHPDEIVPFREEGPENVIMQASRREVVSHDDEIMSSDKLMSEPENKKTPSSEEDPEVHTDESKPTHELTSEAENKRTFNNEDAITPES